MKSMFLAVILFAVCSCVSASERISIGVEVPVVSGPVYYSGGHYETRTVSVLVEPAQRQYVVIKPEYVEKVVVNGVLTEVKHSALYEERIIPARYETRCETVWVPGYVVEPSARIGFGFGFGFGFHDHDHGWHGRR
jgi:hypothetical protein